MTKRSLAVVVFLWCASAAEARVAAPAPSGFTAAGLKNVRAVVQAAIDRGTIPGAVALVARDGRPALFEAFGQARPDRKMTTDALFRIASMTKPITSVAILMLVEDGRVRLDDPLARYLPEFAAAGVIDP